MVGLAGESAELRRQRPLHARADRRWRQRRRAARRCPAGARRTTQLFGNALVKPLGTRPTRPDKKPPYKPNTDCYKNKRTRPERPGRQGRAADDELSHGQSDPETPAGTSSRSSCWSCWRCSSAATSSPTSASTCPAGCRSSARDFFELKGEFQTAQSVMPGQGQTVDIAGVKVGDVKSVELEGRPRDHHDDGPEEVRGRRLQGRVHAAAAEDRPQRHDRRADARHAGRRARRPEGYTVPIRNTLPNVNLEEFFAVFDRDTRDYLQLLLAGGGQGLEGPGPQPVGGPAPVRADQPRHRARHAPRSESGARTSPA